MLQTVLCAVNTVDTSFVFLAHWVPAMISLNIFQNGAWRPSWICALQGHSRIQHYCWSDPKILCFDTNINTVGELVVEI